MPAWLDSIMSPLNAAGDTLQKLTQVRDLAKFGDTFRKMHGEVLTAMQGAVAAQTRHDAAAVLCAFDLLELDGNDLRQAPIEERKAVLGWLLKRNRCDGITFNEHHALDGAIIFKHACALGCEGIVSKRLGSPYRSGRLDSWIKVKNPAAPAVKREAEEEWN